MKKVKVAASLIVRDVPSMTPKGRADVVAWLRRIASDISKRSQEFSDTFRARYLYEEKQ